MLVSTSLSFRLKQRAILDFVGGHTFQKPYSTLLICQNYWDLDIIAWISFGCVIVWAKIKGWRLMTLGPRWASVCYHHQCKKPSCSWDPAGPLLQEQALTFDHTAKLISPTSPKSIETYLLKPQKQGSIPSDGIIWETNNFLVDLEAVYE